MNKERALEIAKDFVDDTITNLDLDKENFTYFSDTILEDDPNLEILKAELNKVGFDIVPSEKPNWWNVTKLK